MSEITAITAQVKDKTRCNIYLDNRFYCGLTLECVVVNRLKVGQHVTKEQLDGYQLESEKATALDKALTYITATQKTEKQIRDYLQKKGYVQAVVEYVIEKMRGYNFLNDESYAQDYVQEVSGKKGGKLIKMELRKRGVSEDAIDRALDELPLDEQIRSATEILQKYLRYKHRDQATLQKAFRYLLGKGFDYEIAKDALKSLGEDGDEEF